MPWAPVSSRATYRAWRLPLWVLLPGCSTAPTHPRQLLDHARGPFPHHVHCLPETSIFAAGPWAPRSTPSRASSHIPTNWLRSGSPGCGLTFHIVGEAVSRNNNLKALEAFSLEKTRSKENVSREGCMGEAVKHFGVRRRSPEVRPYRNPCPSFS